MSPSTFFGYKCPRCGTTVQVGVAQSSGEPSCPNCHATMVPNPDAPGSGANVYCPKCEIAVGLATTDHCPQCGGPWSAA